MEELIPVNILVGDRNYRLKIKPADEENLRKTIRVINNKLVEFKTNFAGKDMQDYIAMVLIWLATEEPAIPFSNEEVNEISKKIKSLQQIITDAL
jgi:cell division protein ZapA